MKRRGFTLLELVVVIIIVGILASIGLTQYTTVVEKGRAAEAKAILGQIRTAQQMHKQETNNYTTTPGDLALDMPSGCTNFYFTYALTDLTKATATRCNPGKGNSALPSGCTGAYTVEIDYDSGNFNFTGCGAKFK